VKNTKRLFLSKERRKLIGSLLRTWRILDRREESKKGYFLLVAIFVGFGIYVSMKLLLPIIPAVFDLSPQPQETLSLKNVIVSEIFKLSDAILFFCLHFFFVVACLFFPFRFLMKEK